MPQKAAIAVIFIALVSILIFRYGENDEPLQNAPVVMQYSHSPANPEEQNTTLARAKQAIAMPAPAKQQAEAVAISGSPANVIDQIRAIQDKTDFHESLIKEHESFNRYPAFNKQFSNPERDPVAERYESYERETLSEDKESKLTLWSDKKYYLPGEQAQIFAKLETASDLPIAASFGGQLIFSERRLIEEIGFENENGISVARIELAPDTFQAGIYKVLVANSHNDLADAITFTLSRPEAHLTGEFRERINDQGNLLVEAEVAVEASNRYYLEASLYSETGTAIGTSQFSGDFSAGKHWLPLEFYGLMIHDAQEHGPYAIKNLSLAKVAIPIQRAPLSTMRFSTQAYRLEEFSSRSYADKDSL